MTVWINTLRRWFGFVEHPPAVSGVTSIMFVLQSAPAALTFAQIRERTNIVDDDLDGLLEALILEGRVVELDEMPRL